MIVDEYGNAVYSNRGFNRSANNSTSDRPWVPTRLDDIGKLISPYERKTLVAVSRLLGENWGPARAILRQISMYSVGKAWKPSIETKDEGLKQEAELAIREKFCPLAGLDGKDFTAKLYELAMAFLRDGDAFYLLTEWGTGFPAVQVIPAHRIGQRQTYGSATRKGTVLTEGRYKGQFIEDGVIKNRNGTVLAYRVLGDSADEDIDVSSRSLRHIFDSDYSESCRGYPVLAHGLNDGRDALQAHEWERLNMLARSSKTMIEHNETGIPDENPDNHFSNNPSCEGKGVATGTLFGGAYKTVRAGTGYKLESVEHTTPGEIWESFQDRMEGKVCQGVPWPQSFISEGHGRGGGTSERRDIMQARQTIEDVQCTLERHARNIIGYAYQKLVKVGQAPATDDWWRWSFSKPPKLSIDDGRVSKAMLELWRAGLVSDDDMLTDMGKDSSDYWRAKFMKSADKELEFIEVQAAKGVKLDPRVKGMFTPNDMGNDEEEETKKPKSNEDDSD